MCLLICMNFDILSHLYCKDYFIVYFLWVRLSVSFLIYIKSRGNSSAKQVTFFLLKLFCWLLGTLNFTSCFKWDCPCSLWSLSATQLCCGITSPFLTPWILCKYDDASIYLKILSLISDLNYWRVCMLYALDFTIV